jgi:transcription antitermination factor NusG
VCWFVNHAGVPAPISSWEIELVRKLVENPSRLQPYPFLERGDPVRVIRGPLVGLSGTLARVKNQHRVVVSIELLRKSAAVEVELSSLERVYSRGSFSSQRNDIRSSTLVDSRRSVELGKTI